jgi:hypothetical protein
VRALFVNLLPEGLSGSVMLAKYHSDEMRDIGMTYNQLLQDLQWRLSTMLDRSLGDFGLPEPDRGNDRVRRDAQQFPSSTAAKRQAAELIATLKTQQKCASDHILHTVQEPVQNRHGNFTFVDAEAGTGKTHLAKSLAAHLRANGKVVACCGTTGLVALNHDGGTTAHFLFGIPVDDRHIFDDVCEPKTSKIEPNSMQWEYLQVPLSMYLHLFIVLAGVHAGRQFGGMG